MANTYERIYNAAPWCLKELLVSLEAWRRNRHRRYGDYAAVRRDNSFDHYRLPFEAHRALQLESLQALITTAKAKSPYYRYLPDCVHSLDDLGSIPVLTKSDVRQHTSDMITQGTSPNKLWKGITSGSTGTPLTFYVGKTGIRERFAIQDEYYAIYGCEYGTKRVRFGGSKIAPSDRPTPPFWIINRYDNQLQMSPYHMRPDRLALYVGKLNQFQPLYLTGYAHALYNLGKHLVEHGGLTVQIRAIFTDSEGTPPHYISIIEEGFNTQVHDVYGLGEVGWAAVQCPQGKYHILERTCIMEIVDDDGKPVPPKESGRIVVTDLTQTDVPYIRYDTGDMGTLSEEVGCACGWQTRILQGIDGRADDLLITPSGRRVGRLSHVTKPGRGIRESQIVQTAPDKVVIRVVPLPSFDSSSMEEVVAVARMMIGENIDITWETVDSIPRTNRHKFKHVLREFTPNA